MTLEEYLSGYGDYLTAHLKNWCSRRESALILPLTVLKEIELCFSNIQKLNEYIYINHFHECMDYLDIKSNWVKELMLHEYPKTDFLDHNIISRLDVFFTKKWVQIAEINHDTPGWWIETYFLNQQKDVPSEYINPNKHFAELFGNAFVRRGIKDIFLLTGMWSRLDKKMLSFLGNILDYYGITNKIGIFEWLTDKDWEIYSWTKKLVNIHKDIPIDRLCNNYDSHITSMLVEKIKNNTITISNNPVGYVFQVKSYFAFLYEQIDKFPYDIQNIIFSYIPKTKRIDKNDPAYINKDHRVIKHVNKRLGQDVYIGKKTNEKEWEKVIAQSDNNRIAQEYFEVIPILTKYINFWVYGLDGKFGWVYTRISSLAPKTTEIDDYTCPLFFWDIQSLPKD